MSEELDAQQFQSAVADAIKGVLNVYRGADAMLRELRGALGARDKVGCAFVPLIERLVPGIRRQEPDARYLRSYIATVFTQASADEIEEDTDDDDDDDDEEDEGKPTKKALIIKAGSGIVVARVTFYGHSPNLPNLAIRFLTNCNVEKSVAKDTELRVSRGRFRKVLRAIDGHTGATGVLKTNVSVSTEKPKELHKLTVQLGVPKTYPLFEITPPKLEQIAHDIRASWVG